MVKGAAGPTECDVALTIIVDEEARPVGAAAEAASRVRRRKVEGDAVDARSHEPVAGAAPHDEALLRLDPEDVRDPLRGVRRLVAERAAAVGPREQVRARVNSELRSRAPIAREGASGRIAVPLAVEKIRAGVRNDATVVRVNVVAVHVEPRAVVADRHEPRLAERQQKQQKQQKRRERGVGARGGGSGAGARERERERHRDAPAQPRARRRERLRKLFSLEKEKDLRTQLKSSALGWEQAKEQFTFLVN